MLVALVVEAPFAPQRAAYKCYERSYAISIGSHTQPADPENRCQHPALRCLNLLLHHILAITDRMIMGMQIEAMTIPILRRRL